MTRRSPSARDRNSTISPARPGIRPSRPWCLTVSFSHPHDPYVARRKYWDLYENCQALDPETGYIPFDEQDPHSQRLYRASDYGSFDIGREHVRRSRRGYFANISWLDDRIGELLSVLESTRMLDDTIVVLCSDHGDMLGERGLWFKMCFFEGSVARAADDRRKRHRGPDASARRSPTSTCCRRSASLPGSTSTAIAPWTDGRSLLPLIGGAERSEPVLMEYAAEGSSAPIVAIREGRYKFVHCEIDPPQLHDLESDPLERLNLAADPANAALVAGFMEKVRARWDMAGFDAAVRESQARRRVVYPALRNGAYFPWDFQPLQKASERYMRNHMDLNILEESKRFPRGE